MRAIVHRTPDGDERFLAELDVNRCMEQAKYIIDEYMKQSEALAAAHEALRKDPHNFTLLFRLSACVNNLCNITLAVREVLHEPR